MKKIYILTILFALFGISQSWAASVTFSQSDISDGKVIANTEHIQFVLVSEDYSIKNGDDNGFLVWKSLGARKTKNVTLTWSTREPSNGFDIAITGITFKAKAYSSSGASYGKLSFNGGEDIEVGTINPTSGGGWSSTIGGSGNYNSGVVIALKNQHWGLNTFDYHFKEFTVEYTVTPKGKPSVAVSEPQEVNVTVDLANKQTVDLKSLFAMPEGVPSDFKFGYQVSGGVVEGDNFYATSAGEYTVKARIAAKENCHEASDLSDDDVTIVVNRLDQTLSWVDEAAINTNMIIDSEQKITAVATSGCAVTYTSSNANVLSVDAEGNLKALAEGEATITVSRAQDDQYNAAESISKTFKVRLKDTPFFKPNDFVTLDSCAVTAFGKATIELSYVSDGLDGEFTATPADEEIISVTREGNILTIDALKVGTTTLTLTQQENALYYGASQTYKIEVTRLENTIYVNGEAEFAKDITFDAYLPVVFTSDNYEEGAPAFVVEQLSGEEIAQYEEGAVIANFREGTATWKVSQAESGNFKAAEAIFSVTVKKAAEAICYVLDDPEEQQWATINRTKEYPVSGPAAKLIFQAKRTAILGFSNNEYFFAEYSEEETGDNWNRLEPYMDLPETGQWYDCEYDIPEGTKRVRMRTVTGATGNRHIQNVKVTRKTYVRAEDIALELFPEQDGEGALKVDYSLANGGDLKIVCDNDLFTLDSYSIAAEDCNDGKAEIPVHFAAQTEQQTYTANVIIYNDVYSKTVQLSANVRKLTPEISWDNIEMVYGDEKALDATVDAELDIHYAIVGETDVIHIENGIIYADKAGEAQIKAFVDATGKYNEAEKIITVTVKKAAQTIEWTQELTELEAGSFIQLNATASSGLEVTFVSSDETIAYVDESNVLHAVSEGEVTVKAVQVGNEYYESVETEAKALTIIPSTDQREEQVIIWEDQVLVVDMAEGAETVVLTAYLESGLDITYESSDETIAKVGKEQNELELWIDIIVPVRAGKVRITASREGDDTFKPAVPVTKEFEIINSDDPETAVENVENAKRATKILLNGQIFILRDGKIYDLRGQRVE